MDGSYNVALMLGAILSLVAALMHIWVIAAGPDAYRLCGAGERFVRAAERGRRFPAVVTAGIAAVLAVWAAYALSGAQLIGPLPLLKPVLCLITLVYMLRGLLGPWFLLGTGRTTRFVLVSSAICTAFGLAHLVGLVQVWELIAT